jgi:hypothetical protein
MHLKTPLNLEHPWHGLKNLNCVVLRIRNTIGSFFCLISLTLCIHSCLAFSLVSFNHPFSFLYTLLSDLFLLSYLPALPSLIPASFIPSPVSLLSFFHSPDFTFTAFTHLNYPPWLGKFLKFTYLKWPKAHLNYPPWLEKFLYLLISNGQKHT